MISTNILKVIIYILLWIWHKYPEWSNYQQKKKIKNPFIGVLDMN